MTTSHTINTTSERPLHTMRNLEGVQRAGPVLPVWWRNPQQLNIPRRMQQPTDTDLMLMKCLETQERQTLQRKAQQSLNGWRQQGVRQTGKKHQREWCAKKWKNEGVGPVLGHTTPQLCPAEHPDFTQFEITTWHIQGGGNEHFQNSFTVASKVLSTLCKLIH